MTWPFIRSPVWVRSVAGSVSTLPAASLMHSPPLITWPSGQRHALSSQNCPPLQTVPQAPQCMLLTRVSVSQPVRMFASQFAKSSVHAASWHSPLMHTPSALSASQRVPQPPQFSASAVTSVSQPVSTSPSQLDQPTLHAEITQAPSTQSLPAFGNTQAFPQAPQSDVLDAMSVSQPVSTRPSHEARPASHAKISHVPMTH
ncbi:MAG: hypothetical protein EA398_01770 [Deltaproteobacteria bacterium]|nr:MAG: hypothetical protein EA398_01770 [Deltaproteobacteria bacterium]